MRALSNARPSLLIPQHSVTEESLFPRRKRRHIKEQSRRVSMATPFSGIDAAQELGHGVGRKMAQIV